MLRTENPIIVTCFEDESYFFCFTKQHFSQKKWRSRCVFMARISSVIGNLSNRKHYYNLLYFQSQKPIEIFKKIKPLTSVAWKHFSKINSGGRRTCFYFSSNIFKNDYLPKKLLRLSIY
jgi:hypothetical protein